MSKSYGIETDDLKENFEVTDYLKGVAIFAVYSNHFINGYVTHNLKGYANGFISIFFLLSGYGIFNSLKRISERNPDGYLLQFFKKRLFRIYPLFWLWCFIHGFSNGLLGFFALDIIHPKSPWFIPAILQCYILAPFLYIALRNLRVKISLLIIFPSFITLNFIIFEIVGHSFRSIGYRGLFFNHIFLFCLGFLLAKTDFPKKMPNFLIILSIVTFIIFVQETSGNFLIAFFGKNLIFRYLFPFSTFFVCYTVLSKKIYLPLQNFLQIIGKYSYSIYLFHGLGFDFLYKFGLLGNGNTSIQGIMAIIVFTPTFIFCYSFVEIIVNEIVIEKKGMDNILKKVKKLVFAFIYPFQQSAMLKR